MQDEKVRMTGGEIVRWSVLALLLIACIVLYFEYAPTTPPAIRPAAVDTAP